MEKDIAVQIKWILFNGLNDKYCMKGKVMENVGIPIGTKYGCFTIIGGLNEYQEEIEKEIAMLGEKYEEEYRKAHCSRERFDKSTMRLRILSTGSGLKYQCQCKCGQIHYLSERIFLEKRHRNCGHGCGQILRKKHASYNFDYTDAVFESLEIIECIDDNVEVLEKDYNPKNGRSKNIYRVYKLYKCRCYLCGKEYELRSDAFEIKKDRYGYRAQEGYYSDTCCSCHEISSFQWRTIKILQEHGIKYRVEKSFLNLYGVGQRNLLRFDFVILDSKNDIKCLLECQGKQHYEPSVDLGGVRQYEVQLQNDELKRTYAKEHNMLLIEVPYTCDTLKKEEMFLKERGII